jgi:hypothetical protein
MDDPDRIGAMRDLAEKVTRIQSLPKKSPN